jgi:hypothetical protein
MKNGVLTAVQKHQPTNMTQLAVGMGLLKKGQSVSGSFGKKVKSLVPDIADLFKKNMEGAQDKDEGGKTVKPIQDIQDKSYTMLAMEQREKMKKSDKPFKSVTAAVKVPYFAALSVP